jgi:cytochrome P450
MDEGLRRRRETSFPIGASASLDELERDPHPLVTFAPGPHVCLGMHLARLEALTAIDRLLDRLPGLRLDPSHPAPAPRGLVFRKPPALHVVWDHGPLANPPNR